MINKKKTLSPASIVSQKKWASLPVAKKNSLRKMLPDKDKDGVPNKYDCHPKNKRKQEAFLSDDARYLESNQNIETAELIDEGYAGSVFGIKGNKNLVVKVQRDFTGARRVEGPNAVEMRTKAAKEAVEAEARSYTKHSLNSEKLFIPSKIVKMKNNGFIDGDFTGIVRPRVEPIMNSYGAIKPSVLSRLTDEVLEDLRQKVIAITHKGFRLDDGLQVGFDRTGRILIFDAGSLERDGTGAYTAYKKNRNAWLWFLANTGKLNASRIYANNIPSKYEITEAECGVKDW